MPSCSEKPRILYGYILLDCHKRVANGATAAVLYGVGVILKPVEPSVLGKLVVKGLLLNLQLFDMKLYFLLAQGDGFPSSA